MLVFAEGARPPFEICGDYAVVTVCGPLSQHAHWMLDSYPEICTRLEKAFASDAPKVCLRIDSPGGDFQGSLELSRDVRALAKTSGKPLTAFLDSNALSAAYALASAADEVVATDTGLAGSVGVWAPLIDETARDRAMGLNVVIVPSGTRKAERNPHMGLTDAAVTNLQAQVDQMAGLFFDLVAEHRGLGVDALKKLQGAEFMASDALARGLIDRIVPSWASFIGGGTDSGVTGGAAAISTENKEGKAMASAKKSLREALAEYAEGEDKEEAKKASKMLAEMYKEKAKEGDGDGDTTEKPAPDKAKGEGEEEAKAKAEEEAKKARAEEEEKQAKAKAAANLSLAERLHALETERAQDKLNAERGKLLASRPDFSKEVRAQLETASLEFVRKACETWPRVMNAIKTSANALVPGGTRGESQKDGHETTGFVEYNGAMVPEGDYIERKMMMNVKSEGVVHKGRDLELGHMTPQQVEEAHARLVKEGK